ncbi:MAG: hypothetical protein ACFFC1_06215 [Promethearchaeota archaeon]
MNERLLQLIDKELKRLRAKEINYPDLVTIDELERIKEKIENGSQSN